MAFLHESKKKKYNVIAIVGPTASGKSTLGVEIAKKFNGEIVSADSRQVYRGLDIGTGKISKREMRGIRHHLLDIANPKLTYSVAEFKRDAQKKIEEISQKHKIPVVVGGTGFWIDSLLLGLSLPEVPPNRKLREKLETKSTDQLFQMLKKLDAVRAKTIDPKNPRRLVRAIEIALSLGRVPPLKKTAPYRVLWIGIKKEKEELKKRIHTRLVSRVKKGLFTEGKNLHRRGLSWKRFYELGLEYKYMADFFNKKITKKNASQELERAIHHYARRQIVWFKRNQNIHWIQKKSEAFQLAHSFLH